MSRLMMGLRIIFLLMFFTGVDMEVNPLDRCYDMINFPDDIEEYALKTQEDAHELNVFCTNATGHFKCMNDVSKMMTGYTIREFANHWLMRITDVGREFNSLAETEEEVVELCRNGPLKYTDLMMDFLCVERRHLKVIPVKHCSERSLIDYILFTEELQPQRHLSEADSKCIITAYHVGCVAATVYKECGVDSFNRYKAAIKEIGFFQSGMCSSDLKQTLKATFLKSFDVSELRKRVSRAILDLRRRRK